MKASALHYTTLALLLLICLLTIKCSKSKKENETPDHNYACTIEKVLDENHKVAQENTIDGAGLIIKSVYYNDNVYQTFEYENAELTSMSQYYSDNNELQLTQTYLYSDTGMLKEIKMIYGTNTTTTYYFYDSTNKLIRTTFWNDYENPVQSSYTDFTWENSNVIKEETYIKYSEPEGFILSSVIEYKFDSGKNPDKGKPQSIVSDIWNKNNPVGREICLYSYMNKVWDTTIYNYTYQYDSLNYPVEKISVPQNSTLGLKTDTTYYEYYCY